MPTDIAKSKVTPDQILQDMARLTTRQLERVIEQAAFLRLLKSKGALSARESNLLQIINRGLTAEKSARLDELQARLRDETIGEREHAQLLRLTEELERLGAERLKALIELSAIRKTSVAQLMEELNLAEAAYA